jgi:hypothetical protein
MSLSNLDQRYSLDTFRIGIDHPIILENHVLSCNLFLYRQRSRWRIRWLG